MSNTNIPNTDEATEASTTPTEHNFVPTRLDKFFGYFVGADFSPHYTRQDANYINLFSSATFVSVTMATTGAAVALSTGMGIPAILSAPPLALGFTLLDRTFIRMELTERTDRHHKKLQDLYPDPFKPKDSNWDFTKRLLKRTTPLSLRMGIALCTSFVTGNILIEQVAQPEIKAMAEAAVANHNKPFVEEKKRKETEYDANIKKLKTRIDNANKGILTNSIDIQPTRRLPADQDRYERAKVAFDRLTPQIEQAQKEFLSHQNAALEEENGVKLKGRTGVPSCGEQCKIHKTRAQQVRGQLSLLSNQQNVQKSIMDGIGQKEQQDVNAQKEQALQNASQNKTKISSLVVEWSNELKKNTDGRTAAFEEFEQEMKETPGYLTAQAQRGLFNDMYLFGKFQERPGGGAQAKIMSYGAQALVLLFEMAAVMASATRPLSPSENRDAEIRAQTRAGIRRRVRSERLEDIIEERNFAEAIRSSSRPGPWDNRSI